ncbi:ASCH domain-containing protein [Schaalia suimastitidis]|uniref:ASCH domain-containing protein n=1 Tax=Schaalia suimastitidis TaxID=121163 RepID=UPI00040D2047|nr:ASCH domain-containing protein [Schaalia suimastitidis]
MVEEFWARATAVCADLNPLSEAPPAWAFGAGSEQANRLAQLVVDGVKTATASYFADYLAEEEPLPHIGDLGIVLDGQGVPRALIRTTEVDVVPFALVGADHARAEGEGDGSIQQWRDSHEAFWLAHSSAIAGNTHRIDEAALIVCERFTVLYAE